jgi:hypothetical protein
VGAQNASAARSRAPLAGALVLSIAAHVAAFVLLRAQVEPPKPTAPSARFTLLKVSGPPARAAAGSAAVTMRAGADDAPPVVRLPPVHVTAQREVERERGPIASATARDETVAAPAVVVAALPAPATVAEATSADAVDQPARGTARTETIAGVPIVGVGALDGFATGGFGSGRPRLFRSATPLAPVVAGPGDWSAERRALEAQVAEARLVGTLFTSLREALRAGDGFGGAAPCDVRREPDGTIAACDGLDPAVSGREDLAALLARFACVRIERDAQGVRAGPCPPAGPASVALSRDAATGSAR